jgi:hypothetical protein
MPDAALVAPMLVVFVAPLVATVAIALFVHWRWPCD